MSEFSNGPIKGKLDEGLSVPGNDHKLLRARHELERDKFSMHELGGSRVHEDVASLEAEFAKRLTARNSNPDFAGKPFSVKKA